MEVLPETRRPRFRADAKSLPAFTLTERDLAYMLAIGRHEVVQSAHLDLLFPEGSAQKRRRRLRTLFDAGYIQRPREQIAGMLAGAGSKSMAYVLTQKGAALLADRTGIMLKPKANTKQFLHDVETTNASVLFEVACKKTEHLEAVFFDELLTRAPEKTRRSSRPWEWSVAFRLRGERRQQRVRPDRILAARHRELQRAGKPSQKFFFLEADRASMSERSRIAAKFCAYDETFRSETHRTRYGMDNMRVLFVTTSRLRADNMIATLQGKDCSHVHRGLFLFIDRPTLFAAASMREAHWRNGDGKPVTLFS